MRILFAFLFSLLSISATAAQTPHPLPLGECVELRNALETSLGIGPGFFLIEDVEADLAPLPRAPACRINFSASGVIFEREGRIGFPAAQDALRGALLAAGWQEGAATVQFAADGPLGARFAVAKGSGLCVALVELSVPDVLRGDRAGPVDGEVLLALPASARRYRLIADCVTGVNE